jgi:dTDP-4-amino-4,6-dideoxygalactose transaminase
MSSDLTVLAGQPRGGKAGPAAGHTPAGPPREIPFFRTEITAEAKAAAQRVLDSGWVTMGPETLAFEQEFGAWVGAPHAVAVSSCTAAIQLALTALNLPPRSPVLTPTITFCGAVQAIVHAGLRPVLMDTDASTLTVSEAGAAAAAEEHGAAAMVIQHMAGYPVDGAALAAAAGVPPGNVVEDAAHGLGATAGGRPVGSFSRAVCFSFYATKNLPVGEGGAITSTDEEFSERLRTMRLHGMSRDAWRRYHHSGTWRYTVNETGFKANFTDLQAGIARAQLRSLSDWQRRRAEIAARYDRMLAGVPGLELPPRPQHDQHAWHLYVVRIHPEFGHDRDRVATLLAEAGIGTSVHFIPVHHLPYFRRLLGPAACARLPVADRVFPQLLTLPLHPQLPESDTERIAEVLAGLAAR